MNKRPVQSGWCMLGHRFFLIFAVFACLSLDSGLAAAAERVVFAVYRNEVIGGSPGHFVRKGSTTIYAWDAKTRTRKTLFSDADLPIVLLTTYGSGGMGQSGVVIPAKNRIFALAAARESDESGPGTNEPGRIYELTLDGSNEVREIAPVESTIPLSYLLASPEGNTLSYLALKDKKPNGRFIPVLMVVDTAGKTLAKTPLSSFVKDDFEAAFTWTSDGKSLYWTVQPDMDDGSNIKYYVTRWDGTKPRRVPEGPVQMFALLAAAQATAPSGKLFAMVREAHTPGEIMATRELWLRENRVETRIAAFPMAIPASPASGRRGANEYLTFVGWLE